MSLSNVFSSVYTDCKTAAAKSAGKGAADKKGKADAAAKAALKGVNTSHLAFI